jgi:hypothetical protein
LSFCISSISCIKTTPTSVSKPSQY